jgi:hypothetical protein
MKYFKIILASIVAFFAPALPLFFAVGLAIFMDTVFGVWKVKKTGQVFSSSALRKGMVSKMVIYQSCVITMFLLDVWVVGEFMAIFNDINFVATKMLCMALITIEIISINENFEAVTGKSIFHGLKKFLNSYNEIKRNL